MRRGGRGRSASCWCWCGRMKIVVSLVRGKDSTDFLETELDGRVSDLPNASQHPAGEFNNSSKLQLPQRRVALNGPARLETKTKNTASPVWHN